MNKIKISLLLAFLFSVVLGKTVKYEVQDPATKKFCLGIQFEGTLEVLYEKKDGTKGIYETQITDPSSSGSCKAHEIDLNIVFLPEKADPHNQWTISVKFEEDSKDYKISSLTVKGKVDAKMVPEIKAEVDVDSKINAPIFVSPMGKIFKCNTEEDFNLSNEVGLKMKDVAVDAFVDKDHIDFKGEAAVYDADKIDVMFVKDKGKYCIELQATTSINLNYETKDGHKKTYVLRVPEKFLKSDVTGSCQDDKSEVTLKFMDGANQWNLTAGYERKDQMASLDSFELKGTLDNSVVPDIKEKVDFQSSFKDEKAFVSKLGNVLSCEASTKLMSAGKEAEMEISKIHSLSFVEKDTIDFSGPTSICDADKIDVFAIKDKDKYCLEFKAKINFHLSYETSESFKKKYILKVPEKFSMKDVEGSCAANASNVQLTFQPGSAPWTFKTYFKKEAEKFSMSSFEIEGTLDKSLVPDIKAPVSVKTSFHDEKAFISSPENVLSCKATTTIEDTKKENEVELADVLVLAFVEKDKISFDGKKESCPADNNKTKIIIPIVIGVILFVLILTALVIFIIGVKRRQASENENV